MAKKNNKNEDPDENADENPGEDANERDETETGSDGLPSGEPSRAPGERVVDLDIEDELKTSYLTYAMSVIIQRALPDVRDGLKPSQRRILVAMNDLNLGPASRHTKCAGIVGECMKKYHPHGDSAIYPTLVRMAQQFNTRYPLVDGQGNFGSIDGDPPAAMRYTEARMTQATVDLMADLDLDTVDLTRNFDDSCDEPTVLPSRLPNLLVNGSTGIAVGMATSMPPHNVREVCSGLIALIENPAITIDELMQLIPGPDFPTGAYICGREGIRKAYHTGRGLITQRSKYHIDQGKTRTSIIFTEIPYQESKETLINRIVEAVKAETVTGISDVRDESDKKIRLVIELKRDADEDVVINQLFKHTSLQTTFSIINIALANGRPETLNLKELLSEFKKHRMVVIRRRTRHLLRKAEARLHIVEGLLKALDHIDEIITLIRASATVDEAHTGLMSRFAFSDVQAREILQMRLQRLTGLERTKLEEEKAELLTQIADYRDILANERRVLDMIIADCKEIQGRYGDARRTEIIADVSEFIREDLIIEEKVVVTFSQDGYVKRTPLSTYRSQGRGGRGITGGATKTGDVISDLFIASTHDYILFFTTRGRLYWLKVYDIPDLDRTSKGRALVNIIKVEADEQVTSVLFVDQFDESRFILMATQRGTIKKTPLSSFANPKKNGIIAMTLEEGELLIGASLCTATQHVILATRDGFSIRFDQEDVRSMGRTAHGVGGIRLREGDRVVDMAVVDAVVGEKASEPQDASVQEPASEPETASEEGDPQASEAVGDAAPYTGTTLLTVCENGYGKRTGIAEYRIQGRNGSGTINIRTSERNGKVVGLKAVTDDDDIVMITSQGQVMRMHVSDSRVIGRATQGVRMIRLSEGDTLVAVSRVVGGKKDGEETGAPVAPPDAGTPGTEKSPEAPGGGGPADGT